MKAIVIGAGVAGLAASIRLRLKGYEVMVFEANDFVGGKLTEFSFEGFRFDAGPSLFTMPQFVDELFYLAKKNPRDYYSYASLEIPCNYFFSDGTFLQASADEASFIKQFEKINTDAAELKKFWRKTAKIYDITHHVFLEKAIRRLATYFDLKTIWSIFRLPGIDAGRSMNAANQFFFKDKRAQQFFNRYATYNGSNPFKAPATLNVIQHYEHHFGAYFPKGGMISITNALHQLAVDLGVRFELNAKVNSILVVGKRVAGIKFYRDKEEELKADVVFSNMDMVKTYRNLLPEIKAPELLLKQEKSSSAIIFYWGINRKFDQLQLHNVFFSKSYENEFEQMANGSICDDPTVYLNISSKMEQRDAPEGSENWFVMINVPYNAGQNWDALIEKARKDVIKKLSDNLGVDVASLIVCEKLLEPRSIEERTSSFQGALYGNSSNSLFSAFLRHPNKSNRLKGLYFCGGSVHPGGGIPLALLSAKIATVNL